MHAVNYLDHLLSSVLPELTHMFEKLLTHAHCLFVVRIGGYDVAPIVLKLEVPAFGLLVSVMSFFLLLVVAVVGVDGNGAILTTQYSFGTSRLSRRWTEPHAPLPISGPICHLFLGESR